MTKHDLMSTVFLPLMKNSVDKATRIEQVIRISKEIDVKEEQLQIQAMLNMLAEKFVKEQSRLSKIKEMLNMTKIGEMIREDKAIEIARKALREGADVAFIAKITDLDENAILSIQKELEEEKKSQAS